MSALGREQLLMQRPAKQAKFPMGDWPTFAPDDYVTLQAISGRDLVELQKRLQGNKAKLSNTENSACIIAKSLINEDGTKIMTEPGDVDALLAWPVGLLEAMAKEAIQLSGLRIDDEDDEKN